MDFRKFDSAVGGVEQAAIQITKYVATKGHQVVMLCKGNRFSEVKKIYLKTIQILSHID